MKDYIYISGIDFSKKLEEDDEICVLANALLKESAYTISNLSIAKEHIRVRFMEEAVRLIKNLQAHHLQIVHNNKI